MKVSSARLAVLRAAERGEVCRVSGTSGVFVMDRGRSRRVVGVVGWLLEQGLVREVHKWPTVSYVLTDAGREVLAEAGHSDKPKARQGTCPVCGKVRALLKDGTMHSHGPCKGERRLPVEASAPENGDES